MTSDLRPLLGLKKAWDKFMDALILGNHTQGLGIVRSLSDLDLSVHMLNDSKHSVVRFSKHLQKYHSIKKGSFENLHTTQGINYLVDTLLSIRHPSKKVLLFCTNEDLTNAIYSRRDDLRHCYYIPNNNIIPIIDKFIFYNTISAISLLTPVTYVMSNMNVSDLDEDSRYICKGRLGSSFKLKTGKKAIEFSKNQYDSIIDYVSKKLHPDEIVVQAKIENNDRVYSSCGFSIDGSIIQEFQYLKLRQFPAGFGTGTYLESVRNEKLTSAAAMIIKEFEYTGIFELEFLTYENSIMVLEMNPRTWKSINFATDCGQNLVASYACYGLNGVKPEASSEYKTGLTWAHIVADITSCLSSGTLPKYRPNTKFAVFALEDPLPFLFEIATMPILYWERIRKLFRK